MEDSYRASPITTRFSFNLIILFLCILIPLVSPASVFSREPEQQKKTVPDSIDGALEQRDDLAYDPRRRSLFPDFYYNLRDKRHDWYQKHGIEFTVTYDALVQGYNDRDISVGGAAGDLSLSGRWLLFGERFKRPTYLSFRFRDRRAYSEYAPSDIQRETDLLWGTVHGFNNSGFQIPDFYFEHELFDDDLALRYGQFSIRKFVDTHSLRGAKRFFLNEAFSDNPTVNFPSYGAGFSARWRLLEKWEITGGVSNIQGTEGEHYVDFSLDSTALFGTLQVAYNFKGIGQKDGRIQVMGWGSEDNNEKEYSEGTGVSFTFQHDGVAEGEIYALRYAQSSGDPTNTDIIIFLGYSNEIRGFDNFGLGVGTGRSSSEAGWQTVFETFYRWQITKELLITPDVQLILGDDLSGNSKTRIVAGIRAGVIF